MTREEFVKQAYEAACQSSSESGMPARVTVAQAALESGWGNSKLAREANNYFGIKACGKQEKVRMSTVEVENGTSIATEANFARYGSMQECFAGRDQILLHGAVYAQARLHLDDEVAFIAAMARHWATDSHYAAKLTAVLGEVIGMLG